MTRRTMLGVPLLVVALAMSGAAGLAHSAEQVDLDAITRIKAEGFDRSQVMDIAWWLTDVHGPRLTNSPQMRAAAEWTLRKAKEWGLANAALEPWGANAEFGRSSGGFVNVLTKSGTNELHGSTHYYLKNGALSQNARHGSVELDPDFSQHQFGFTLGGPLRRDKAFFFIAATRSISSPSIRRSWRSPTFC